MVTAQVTDPAAVLLAYVTLYDQRDGGIETSFKNDKGGLGLTRRNKKRFEAQQMLVLAGAQHGHLGTLLVGSARRSTLWHLAHGARCLPYQWLARFDPTSHMMEIVLNQRARRAHGLLRPLRELLAPSHIVIHLGET